MNRRLVFLLLTVWASMLIQVGPILAQGLILKLPSDGTWSRFRVTGQYDVSWLRDLNEFPDDWKDLLATIPDFAYGESELVVSSVGTNEIDGERFRWIELYLKGTTVGEAKGDRDEVGKMHGGEHGSLIHQANYTVIADATAPFGVKQIWETKGVSIEDSGPYDPKDDNCDGPGTISRGNSQIVLIESGIGAVSRLKALETKSQRKVTPAIQSPP